MEREMGQWGTWLMKMKLKACRRKLFIKHLRPINAAWAAYTCCYWLKHIALNG